MSDYRQKLIDDLLEQFKGTSNTKALMSAIAKQLQEVFSVYEDLKHKRSMERAEGSQLDGIGDIVVLPRSQARAWKAAEVLDDASYRELLKYKTNLNTSTSTYRDIVNALKMFWPEMSLSCSEDYNMPATMMVTLPAVGPHINMMKLMSAPILNIKAGGVRLLVVGTTETPLPVKQLRVAGAVFAGTSEVTLPELILIRAIYRVAGRVDFYSETELPQIQ